MRVAGSGPSGTVQEDCCGELYLHFWPQVGKTSLHLFVNLIECLNSLSSS